MDFRITKPRHIFALIMLISTFFFFLLIPLFSFFDILSFSQVSRNENISEYYSWLAELLVLFLQVFLAFFLLIIVPLFWYKMVNNFGFDQIKLKLKLEKNKIGRLLAISFITTIVAFFCVVAIGTIFISLGYDLENASNIPDLELYFSLPALLIIILLQPIAEEFFFRGFLLEKISSISGIIPATLATSILFGIAHISYGNVYPAITTIFVGLLFAYVVVKTNSLYSSIIAHVLYNLISFGTYIFLKSYT